MRVLSLASWQSFDPKHILWSILLIVSAIVFAIAFSGGDWIHPAEGSRFDKDLACGIVKYIDAKDEQHTYGSLSDNPIMWWRICTVFVGIGMGILFLSAVGSIVTMVPCAQPYQGMVHNASAGSSILIFVGLIFFCVGFKDMVGEGDGAGCKFCGEDTSAFVLVDCTIGDHLIMCIIAVILVSITSCVGYFIHHRRDGSNLQRTM